MLFLMSILYNQYDYTYNIISLPMKYRAQSINTHTGTNNNAMSVIKSYHKGFSYLNLLDTLWQKKVQSMVLTI